MMTILVIAWVIPAVIAFFLQLWVSEYVDHDDPSTEELAVAILLSFLYPVAYYIMWRHLKSKNWWGKKK